MLQVANFHHAEGVTSATFPGSAPTGLQALFQKQPVERVAAGQSLFFEGDAATHLFEVIEGSLRIFKIISDGRRVITGFLHDGDIIGVSLKSHYLYSAEAVTDIKVRRISRRAFETAVDKSPDLRPEVFVHLCDEMAAAQDQMVLLSRKNAEERVCSFLLKELLRDADRRQCDAIIELPMTRLDIADYLGLTIETVSRTMTKLTNKGVVAPAGRHSVRIVKRSALVLLAGNDDEYVDNMVEFASYARGSHH